MIRTALSQSFDGTDLLAFLAEDALGGILAVAGIFVHLNVHRADFQALAALDALALVAAHTQQRKIAHRLQEDRDGADVFAEGAIEKEEVCHKKSYRFFPSAAFFLL